MLRKRKQLRLKDYDYGQEGAYFVTICTFERQCLFGKIDNGKMILNDMGKIVRDEWLKTPIVRLYIALGEFVVMPNHVHGVIEINKTVGATRRVARTSSNKNRGPISGSIGAIIGQYKSKTTKRINKLCNTPSRYVWQRNYFDHIIRNDIDLNRIRQYINENPINWDSDRNNPINLPVGAPLVLLRSIAFGLLRFNVSTLKLRRTVPPKRKAKALSRRRTR